MSKYFIDVGAIMYHVRTEEKIRIIAWVDDSRPKKPYWAEVQTQDGKIKTVHLCEYYNKVH